MSKSGKDAYAIKSSARGVTITGSNERSTWYGLYDLLERRGGCHWFWDCDVVPKKATIDLSRLDVAEEAQFEYRGLRYFAHRGLTRFQAEHWGLEDWKKEIDWCLKRRLNVFMLRIGQDDLFQRAFPETCAYPDPSKDLPGHGKGYDNRTLFWSLQFRGKLRQDLQKYAFARGLLVPEDFGTMTHWYSRTPEDFLDGKKPPFLPQSTGGYSERNGLVWDIRDPKWVDAYWKLTTVACDAYGKGRDQELLHTIGLGEDLMLHNGAAKSSRMEKMSGIAAEAFRRACVDPKKDLLVVISASGKNAAPVEMCECAKAAGVKLVTISSSAYVDHGAKLISLGDIAIDCKVPYGDAVIDVGDGKMGGLSTYASLFILNTILIEGAKKTLVKGAQPPIYTSGNVAGGTAKNVALEECYFARVKNL